MSDIFAGRSIGFALIDIDFHESSLPDFKERWQVSSLGAIVFKERCCRLSYGILYREEYDPENNPTHVGQTVIRSRHDGKLWVEGQIDWFVKQVRGPSNITRNRT